MNADEIEAFSENGDSVARCGRSRDRINQRFFNGPEVSVCYLSGRSTESEEKCHAQTKLALTLEPAECVLRLKTPSGDWCERRLSGRRICCIAAQVIHTMRWEQEADAIEIYLESRFLRQQVKENVAALVRRDALPSADNDPVIWELAGAICFLCFEPRPDDALITNAAAMIARRLVHCHANPRAVDNSRKFSPEQRQRLDSYIQTNLAQRFRVPHLAKAMALSAPHLTALCRNSTGKPPMEYVRECRLLKAHGMALAGNHRIGEMARACGFYDASHLNREFKIFFKKSVRVLSRRPESSRGPIKS